MQYTLLHFRNCDIQEIAEPPLDLESFQRATDLNFAAIRAKTGRVYYVNPYYVAAWSNVFQVRFICFRLQFHSIDCSCLV